MVRGRAAGIQPVNRHPFVPMTTAKDVPVGTPTKRYEMEHPLIEGVVDPPADHALGPDHVRSNLV